MKMNLLEKNRAVARLTSDITHFEDDLKLLKSISPSHPLVLEKQNRFTRQRIHAKVVYALLGKISMDDILTNRMSLVNTPKDIAISQELNTVSAELVERDAFKKKQSTKSSLK